MASFADTSGFLVVAVFGWPAATLAGVLAIAAVAARLKWFAFAAALVATPFSVYLAANPPFRYLGLIFPALLFLSGVALQRKKALIAAILALPFPVFVLWLTLLNR